ncbi:hypothetical protein PR048_023042 [Dryococelus australis]|uniref:Uncharacterized protein n=1 Tax=Dryococelus australis TaxID=614101 RepID=A0ABQ9GSZ3_9NEOP|nr:hypothetical protein PR048_023042 [Dryococelus australis]
MRTEQDTRKKRTEKKRTKSDEHTLFRNRARLYQTAQLQRSSYTIIYYESHSMALLQIFWGCGHTSSDKTKRALDTEGGDTRQPVLVSTSDSRLTFNTHPSLLKKSESSDGSQRTYLRLPQVKVREAERLAKHQPQVAGRRADKSASTPSHLPYHRRPIVSFPGEIWPDIGRDTKVHGGRAVKLLASHLGEPGSIPSRFSPDFGKWESCRTMLLVGGFSWVMSRFLRPFIPFRHCFILASLHPHRLSRPPCYEPSKSLHSQHQQTTLHMLSIYAILSRVRHLCRNTRETFTRKKLASLHAAKPPLSARPFDSTTVGQRTLRGRRASKEDPPPPSSLIRGNLRPAAATDHFYCALFKRKGHRTSERQLLRRHVCCYVKMATGARSKLQDIRDPLLDVHDCQHRDIVTTSDKFRILRSPNLQTSNTSSQNTREYTREKRQLFWRTPTAHAGKMASLASKICANPFANQSMVTRRSSTSREFLVARSSRSGARTVSGASRSQSENGYTNIQLTATPFHPSPSKEATRAEDGQRGTAARGISGTASVAAAAAALSAPQMAGCLQLPRKAARERSRHCPLEQWARLKHGCTHPQASSGTAPASSRAPARMSSCSRLPLRSTDAGGHASPGATLPAGEVSYQMLVGQRRSDMPLIGDAILPMCAAGVRGISDCFSSVFVDGLCHGQDCLQALEIGDRSSCLEPLGRLLTARSSEPMRVIEVNMEQRRNEEAGETGDRREDPPTNGIVRQRFPFAKIR